MPCKYSVRKCFVNNALFYFLLSAYGILVNLLPPFICPAEIFFALPGMESEGGARYLFVVCLLIKFVVFQQIFFSEILLKYK